MSSIVKIAIGTALGILLAGAVAVVVVFAFLGAALTGGDTDSEPTAASATATPQTEEAGGRVASGSRSYARAVKPRSSRLRSRKAAPALVFCDSNIAVNPKSTTCAFAQNAFFSYWIEYDSPGSVVDASGYPVYSSALEKTLTLRCDGAAKVVCVGAAGAYVEFPMSAVEAYTRSNAERYLSYADTGGIEPVSNGATGNSDSSPPEPGDSGQTSYGGGGEDRPDVEYDLDCADFDGPVAVSPDDPHDLDRDGDGTGCDA
jgi:hypothetical protein